MSRHRGRRSDEGFTLVETLIVLFIVGLMAALAIGSFAGTVQGMKDSLAATTLQATRVALASATVNSGTLPVESDGSASPLGGEYIMLPSDSSFRMGYMPGCFQSLSNTGASTSTWLHNGPCTSADRAAGPTGIRPVVESNFVLCAQAVGGPMYVADTWHNVQKYVAGATWPDGTTMQLRGCEVRPLEDGAVVPGTS